MKNILCLSIISLLPTVHGSKFTPNCTLPPKGTNYVSGPNTRGTMSILWNCLSIIFLCTWSIQHLNIPVMRPETNSTWRKIWWAILDSRTKIKWMVFSVLVPEFIIGKALNEMIAVYHGLKLESREYPFSADKVSAHMANMGYFVVDFGDYWLDPKSESKSAAEGELPLKEQNPSELVQNDAEPIYSMKQTVEQLLEFDDDSASTQINLRRMLHRYWALSSYQLDYLIPNIIDPHTVPVRQMEVLNRGNALIKVLALLQIVYLLDQLVARKLAGLPSTQLEIGALAFSVCSIITYILYWNRPQGVESIQIIKAKSAPSEALILLVARHGPTFMWTKSRPRNENDKLYDVASIPNDALSVLYFPFFSIDSEVAPLAIGSIFGGTIFGGLHCLAWNFHFPTHTEVLAWRICSCLTSILPPIAVVPLSVWILWHPWGMEPQKPLTARLVLGLTLIFGFLVPYVLARLFLLVEMFRTLFFLPPEAFVETGSGSLLHWG